MALLLPPGGDVRGCLPVAREDNTSVPAARIPRNHNGQISAGPGCRTGSGVLNGGQVPVVVRAGARHARVSCWSVWLGMGETG